MVMRELLECVEARVTAVASGERAVALVRGGFDFDAVLMDVQMPTLDGFETTRLIREALPGVFVPVIAMTARATEDDRRFCLQRGMDDHIGKPIEPVILYETLARWLEPGLRGDGEGTLPERRPGREAAGVDPGEAMQQFDVAGALRRVDGNRRLLRRMLAGFLERFTHLAGLLRTQGWKTAGRT